MEKEFEHKGIKYWVKIESAIHDTTKETGFIAYVSDEKPHALSWGNVVRDPSGSTMFFTTELSALTNANAIKQSEIDAKP